MTLAAYECGSVDFPEPPYPEQIICPQEEVLLGGTEAVAQVGVEGLAGVAAAVQGSISLWTIVSKVRLEACMWVSLFYIQSVHSQHTVNCTAHDT